MIDITEENVYKCEVMVSSIDNSNFKSELKTTLLDLAGKKFPGINLEKMSGADVLFGRINAILEQADTSNTKKLVDDFETWVSRN